MLRKVSFLLSIFMLFTFLAGCTKYPDLDPVMGSSALSGATEKETESFTEGTGAEGTEAPPPTSNYSGSGIFESDTGTTLTLRMQWEAAQNKTEHRVDLTVRVYLEYLGGLSLTPSENNTLTIGNEQITFSTKGEYLEGSSPILLCEHTCALPRNDGADMTVRMVAKVYSGCTYEGYEFKSLTAQGNLHITDKYAEMPEKASVEVGVIKQYPELPNGCEVTSLAMALNYHGYKISKMQLKNGYLPIGSENIYEYNIGDPAKKGSYGCYSPVIKRTADAFFADKGVERTATDLTHCNTEELYYRVSCGSPVIVWATQYMEKRPTIIKSWEIDGIVFNWKAPLHCMLLTGYDKEAGTVTLTDPIYGVVTHDMKLFEERWHQMGEQAVIV